jgi:hypothetical protein
MLNTTFNNDSVIYWRSILLEEESGVPKKTTDLLSQVMQPVLTMAEQISFDIKLTNSIT